MDEKTYKAKMIKMMEESPNIILCEKCGNYHRFDYDCAMMLKALKKMGIKK